MINCRRDPGKENGVEAEIVETLDAAALQLIACGASVVNLKLKRETGGE